MQEKMKMEAQQPQSLSILTNNTLYADIKENQKQENDIRHRRHTESRRYFGFSFQRHGVQLLFVQQIHESQRLLFNLINDAIYLGNKIVICEKRYDTDDKTTYCSNHSLIYTV